MHTSQQFDFLRPIVTRDADGRPTKGVSGALTRRAVRTQAHPQVVNGQTGTHVSRLLLASRLSVRHHGVFAATSAELLGLAPDVKRDMEQQIDEALLQISCVASRTRSRSTRTPTPLPSAVSMCAPSTSRARCPRRRCAASTATRFATSSIPRCPRDSRPSKRGSSRMTAHRTTLLSTASTSPRRRGDDTAS